MGKEKKKNNKNTFTDKVKKMIPGMSAETYKFAVMIYIIFIAVLSIIRVVAIEKSVQFPGFTGNNTNYKLDETIYTRVFTALYILGAIAAFVIGVFSHRVSFSTNKRSNSFVFVSSLAGFCMVGCAGFIVYRSTLLSTSMTKLGYWVIVLMLLTGVYFSMDAVGFVGEKSRPLFSLGTIGFGGVRLAYDFLDLHDVQRFSSNEYHLLSLSLLLIFFCCSTRLYIYGKVGFWYKTFGLFTALSLLIYSLPEIYILLFKPYYVDSTFIFCIVDAVLAFYILTKLWCVKKDFIEIDSGSDSAK